MKIVALVIAAALGVGVSAADAGRVAGARAVPACAAAGPYWPTMTLALGGDIAWVACKEQSRIVGIALPGGRRTATLRLGAPVIAVATGLGSLWALDSGSTLYRIDPAPAGDEAHPGRRRRGVQHLDRRRRRLGR